ncbi:sugar kinase [Aquibacillus koreensis]|uniref:Sugar kinase n=1 Tax=Aquibacillus koreensis TaxID=279446 RepID=A0A9X3WRE2_9BACI|nr:sugar kinase [Aquibacillus koreensis]MCT2537020.1 sugar kinase [Aquibacillus koreensis]MDC3422326.1 sugar kinase [Aquibacillus koreensis]
MDVVTLGETMIVFTPMASPSPLMRYSNSYSNNFGGAETNVAIGLSRLGHQVGWVSKLGKDEFGKSLLSSIRGEGIDVSQVKFDRSAPTGIYFKEVRNSQDVRVQYYRAGSAASRLEAADINEDYIKQAKFLHLTGITPALSQSCYGAVLRAISIAKEHGTKIIFDPNLRRKLWSEDRAREVLRELCSLADIVLPGVDEGAFLFHGEKDPEKLGELFLELGAELVILKVGAKGAFYFDGTTSELVEGFPVEQVVDPVGAGDGFAAGFISGMLDNLTIPKAVERGNAVGAMQTLVKGDYEGLPDHEELEAFVNRTATEDVVR